MIELIRPLGDSKGKRGADFFLRTRKGIVIGDPRSQDFRKGKKKDEKKNGNIQCN